jgi:hypothetical protein
LASETGKADKTAAEGGDPADPADPAQNSEQELKEKPKGYYLIPLGGLVVILLFGVMMLRFKRKS